MLTKNEIKSIRALSLKKERDASQLFVAEGEKLVDELANSHLRVRSIYRVNENCSSSDMERMSMLKTPTSTLGVFEIPSSNFEQMTNFQGRILVLDSLQDPGNLGTIIRTADWFGIRRIICSLNTADAYSPKVVQATMGAICRVEVIYTDLREWFQNFKRSTDTIIYGTFLENSTPLHNVSFARNAIIVMGNEGRGISKEVEQFVEQRVRIERGENGAGESLNVAIATAIMLNSVTHQ